MVNRIYVEKKPGFDVEAQQLLHELSSILGVKNLTGLRLLNRYDAEGLDEELFAQCVPTVFSEPQSDTTFTTLDEAQPGNAAVFAVEPLPGQFDQRSDSASECIQLISQGERPLVHAAKVYLLEGELASDDIERVKRYVINPVECREAALEKPDTLVVPQQTPPPVERIEGFLDLTRDELADFIADRGLAMDLPDIVFCQSYFAAEKRDPTITEIKMIDTYWSDHCRHTTFGTHLTDIAIEDPALQGAFMDYIMMRQELGREKKPLCLMDMGTIGAKYLRARGILRNLDESEEINACTVKVTVDVDGEDQDWLYLFKNETHNHPTEIEPFGGAATCVGGAIRDPLSGRSYVYQAMRVTGAGDPLVPVEDTLPGKLPQRKIVTTAAAGYSSYGNQIGLATGQVDELYHPGYVAKRMEIGAVVAATPASHVRRETPAPGDVIVLLGGRTGRDGIGGATGSSKAHNVKSLEKDGAEVQKGNAPVERKLQRLFRRGDACRLIKRCNDFGAGGVSVAIGELADSLQIDLNKVPKKYEGLDGTELAISESQERMACAVAAADVEEFLGYAREENLEATVVAEVTDTGRVIMTWNGDEIVNINRRFLNSNGAPKYQSVHMVAGENYQPSWPGDTYAERMNALVTDLNICGKKGLSERFDSTIGAGTVLMPFGGVHQLTPSLAMAAKIPVFGETHTMSGMAWGFNPALMSANPFDGAYLAVLESVSKFIASGFDHRNAYLSFQEYFPKLRDDPERWGVPAQALLGAVQAQVDIQVGAIGGKDSMSGSFEDLDVPPTLVSFCTGVGKVERATSPEFKGAGHRIALIGPKYRPLSSRPEVKSLRAVLVAVEHLMEEGSVLACSTGGYGGLAEAIFKMTLGNGIGADLSKLDDPELLFRLAYGTFVVELADGAKLPDNPKLFDSFEIGVTTDAYELAFGGEVMDLTQLQEAWEGKLEPVFPYRNDADGTKTFTSDTHTPLTYNGTIARPRVIIPVFPGNNCEYDSAAAFERAGALTQTLVINNLTPAAVAESIDALVKAINESQIIMIPGGFSGGDEPDGSAKFITAFFRAPAVTEAVRELLNNRDGLILGICNGFQALVKLGLVPYGDIRPMDASCPTLTFNSVGRHQSRLVRTRVASNLSPWLARCNVGDVHTMPISNGEGRFVISDELLTQLEAAGQIATQYVDEAGVPSMNWAHNPSGSAWAIEGITSPDGRVLGKMGHTERTGAGLYVNFPALSYQPLIESGVGYFTE